MNEQSRSSNDPVMNPHSTANVIAINRKELLSKIPLSDRTIFDMEKRGEFPQRFCLSNRVVAWDLAEVDVLLRDWLLPLLMNGQVTVNETSMSADPPSTTKPCVLAVQN